MFKGDSRFNHVVKSHIGERMEEGVSSSWVKGDRLLERDGRGQGNWGCDVTQTSWTTHCHASLGSSLDSWSPAGAPRYRRLIKAKLSAETA